jgi:quinol monooxygenase YgiN
MYVVIRKIKSMRNIEEAGRRALEGLSPIMKQTPGFRAYYVFHDGQGGGSVSLFESREAAEAANAEGASTGLVARLAGALGDGVPLATKGG